MRHVLHCAAARGKNGVWLSQGAERGNRLKLNPGASRPVLPEPDVSSALAAQALQRPENMVVTAEMKRAMQVAKSGQHVFITGRAGTGKSTLLSLMRDECLPRATGYMAPTGVAALNIAGATIHRFFGFGIDITRQMVESREWRPRNPEALARLKSIVIDEISMVRADMLDIIETALRRYGPKPGQSFGGVQLVLFGDMRQLPPVVKNTELRFIEQNFDSKFFFAARALEDVDFEVVELTHNFRQDDPEFFRVLNAIRDGNPTAADLTLINQSVTNVTPELTARAMRLVTTNALADDTNRAELRKLAGPDLVSDAKIRGHVPKDERPTEDSLHYKVGARVMMVNNDQEGRWVNGSVATITRTFAATTTSGLSVEVEIDKTGARHMVIPWLWQILQPKSVGGNLEYEEVGSFEQLPFRLAWAITIHKSQGKTFDDVIVDLSRDPFAAGQTYVALSRCRTLAGLRLVVPIREQHAMTDDVVTAFLQLVHAS